MMKLLTLLSLLLLISLRSYVHAYTVTCSVTGADVLDRVYVNDVEVTSTLTPSNSLSSVTTKKTFTFTEPTEATMVAFLVHDTATTLVTDGSSAFFSLQCTTNNPIVVPWTFRSYNSTGWTAFTCGATESACPTNWYSNSYFPVVDAANPTKIIVSTLTTTLSWVSDQAEKVWVNKAERYVVFRKLIPKLYAVDQSLDPIEPAVCNNNNFRYPYKGRCYFYSQSDFNFAGVAQNAQWPRANDYCDTLLGKFVSVHTVAENNFLQNDIGPTGNKGCGSNGSGGNIKGVCWIGLYYTQGGTDFQWTDGTFYSTATGFWQSGEPNQVNPKNEICVNTLNNPNGIRGYWEDNACTSNYPYVCVQPATCPAGYRKIISYQPLPENAGYHPGLCQKCNAGTYRSSSDPEAQCLSCPGGYFGDAGATNSTCSGKCVQGTYCPLGTARGNIISCPPGKYGTPNVSIRDTQANSCSPCEAGYYCAGGLNNRIQCPAGTCSYAGESSFTCTGDCPAGYYCPAGSACSSDLKSSSSQGLFECAYNPTTNSYSPELFYCPSRSQTRSPVLSGEYAVGGTPNTRTEVRDCPKGYYCAGSVITACPAGKYNAFLRKSSIADCLTCEAGYWCGPASTTGTQNTCAALTDTYPEAVYCPAGSNSSTTVPAGYYSLPEDTGFRYTRSSIAPCTGEYACANGIRTARIAWDASSCPNKKANITIDEMFPANTPVGFQAIANVSPNLNAALYTVTYSIASFYYKNDPQNVSPCAPLTTAKNGNGLFVVDPQTGVLSLSRSNLNFEVCLPVQDISYTLNVRATSVGESTTSTIDCELTVVVNDVNDQPYFNTPVAYRQIEEKSDRNVPVRRCDAVAVAQYNCPFNEDGLDPEIGGAFDEDFGSELVFSIAPGVYDQSNDPETMQFKINSCSGLISMLHSQSISYSNPLLPKYDGSAAYKLQVVASDDGNGGEYPVKSATQIVYVFITNKNDPPVMPSPDTVIFSIYENSAINTPTTPSTIYDVITDEDLDTITLSLQSADSNAFRILSSDGKTLVVTEEGVAAINFESTKQSYSVDLSAYDGKANTVETYIVNILDANDPPTFVNGLTFYIRESAAIGDPVCRNAIGTGTCTISANEGADGAHAVNAIDEDSKNHPEDAITFELLTNNNLFRINSTTGQIFRNVGSPAFNFEDTSLDINGGTGRGYRLTVRARSSGFGSFAPLNETYRDATVMVYLVDVNEPCAFLTSGTPNLFVLEKIWPLGGNLLMDPTTLAILTATDPDNADLFINGAVAPIQAITYSIVPTGAPNDGSAYFSVTTSATGNYPILSLKTSVDFDTAPSAGCTNPKCYKITLSAVDNGGGGVAAQISGIEIAVINTNQAPKLANGQVLTASIDEDADASSQVLTTGSVITAEDVDGDNITYEVAGGSGVQLFSIISSGSGFRVVKKANVALDYEGPGGYEFNLIVRAKDKGPSRRIGSACTDSNDDCGYSGGIGGARCNQLDKRCYEVCSSIVSGASAVDVTLRGYNYGYFCKYLNGEIKSTLYPEFVSISVIVSINDMNDPPIIKSDLYDLQGAAVPSNDCRIYLTAVSNSAVPQTTAPLGRLSATDPDIFGKKFNTTLTWSQGSGIGEDADFWTRFAISSSGVIVNTAVTSEGVTYTGATRVTDGNGGYAQCKVIVQGIINNTPPKFTPNPLSAVSVQENTLPDAVITTVLGRNTAVIDPDVGAILSFSASQSDFYSIRSSDGRITTGKAAFDYEMSGLSSGQIFQVLVRIDDQYGASDVVTVPIQIVDVNEAPYLLPISPPSFTIPENSAQGTLIGTPVNAWATDPDVYSSNALWRTLVFTIVPSSCSSCPFTINTATGQLSVSNSSALDFEGAKNTWDISVSVRDSATPTLSSSTNINVKISLTNVNEAPTWTSTGTTVLSIAEDDNRPSTQVLIDLTTKVIDPDAGDAGLLVFSFVGNSQNFFVEDNKNLKYNGVLDYEAEQSYSFSLRVCDSSNLCNDAPVNVQITNVNDVSITNVARLSGVSPLSCSGSDTVVITGKNFGLKTLTASQTNSVNVTYKYTPANSGVTPVTYIATGCTVTSGDNTEIRCQTVPGVGQNLKWTVSVTVPTTLISSNSATTTASFLSYSGPTISTISASADNANTQGGAAVTLTGSCLGKNTDSLVFMQGIETNQESFVKYCSNVACYIPSCSAGSSGSSLTCTLLPGLGVGFSWSAKIAGQATTINKSGGYYGAPILSQANYYVIPTSGQFATPLKITGSNFGGLNTLPSSASYSYNYVDTETKKAATIKYNLNGCFVSIAYTEVTCTSSDFGVGKLMNVQLEFGTQINALGNLSLNYTTATLTGIDGIGAVDATTTGGQLVTLKGTSFGPVCGVAGGSGCGTVRAWYSKGGSIIYYPSCAVVSDSRMTCILQPGTGAGHVWRVEIGGQEAIRGQNVPTTSYARPTVGAYAGDGAVNANTEGNQIIHIKGSNFGPLNGARIYAVYGDEQNPNEFYSGDCTVVIPHAEIECSTTQGAGADLAWVVYVDGLESVGELMDYGIPEISNFTGISLQNLNPNGGEEVHLHGKNFGPSTAVSVTFPYIQGVFYGPSSNSYAYEAQNCVVLSHFEIKCTTVAGVGLDMSWVVIIGGQQSLPSVQRTSYTAPSIQSVSITSGSTRGGYPLRIYGVGFGVCDDSVSRNVYWNGVKLVVSALYDGNLSVFNPSKCPAVSSNQYIEIIVPEMVSTDYAEINLELSSARLSNTLRAAGGPISFSYDGPHIDTIFAEPYGDSKDILVTIVGENFCASEDCCKTLVNGEVYSSFVQTHTHSKIKVIAPAAGSVLIRCPRKDSTIASFDSYSPFILGTNPELDEARFDTRGIQNVEVWGLYFGDATPEILVGGVNATVISHNQVNCFSDADGTRPQTMKDASIDNSAVCYKTVFRVPEGEGLDHPLVVKAGIQFSNADDPRFEFLSYGDPHIQLIDGPGYINSNPSIGGSVFYIHGVNFGRNGTVYIGGRDDSIMGIKCINPLWGHTLITCQVPEGEGTELDIIVVSADLESNSYCCMSYIPPVITGWEVLAPGASGEALTQGGEVLRLTGSNFGRKQGASVQVGKGNCVVISVSSDFTQLDCLTPEGEGTELTVVANAGDQVATAPRSFDYGEPMVTAIYPPFGPTSGHEIDSGDQIYLEIYGKNFGVDRLRIEFNGVIVVQRVLPDKTGGIVFSNHTYIKVPLPKYFGKNLNVRVVVASQYNAETNFYFSYELPHVQTVKFPTQSGDMITLNINSSSSLFPLEAFIPNGDGLTDLKSTMHGRLLLSENGGYGHWQGNASICEGYWKFSGVFWKKSILIAENGEFERTTMFYDDSECVSGSLILKMREEGTLNDVGNLNPDLFACGRRYSEKITNVYFTPLTSKLAASLNLDAACGTNWAPQVEMSFTKTICGPLMSYIKKEANSTAMVDKKLESYGMYVIAEHKDLYLSSPLWGSPEEVDSAEAFKFPEAATATVVNIENIITPQGPTDGCWIWEDIVTYNKRVLQSIEDYGVFNLPRKCLSPATIEIAGDNFGSDALQIPNSLRVILENELSGDKFEASTTTSPGNHGLLCSPPYCIHTDTSIRFQVPFGIGSGLKIRIIVGNQEVMTSNITFTYLGPRLEEQLPGSVWNRRGFYNADGQNNVILRGRNFGYGETQTGILVNGRVCSNSTWNSGQTDENGQPFITCNIPRDVVGPKSVFVCVGNQTSVDHVFRKDANVLLNGELVGAWQAGNSTQGLHADIQSFSLSRCSEKQTGRLWELCRPCPDGALCEPVGSFSAPRAAETYYHLEIPLFVANENGQTVLNPLAQERCSEEQWNLTLLDGYPDAVVRPNCDNYVRCIPENSCAGSNLCSPGYTYAYDQCVAARNAFNPANNSCPIYKNAYTGEYEGVHSACTGSTNDGEACPSDRPWECSLCAVKYDNDSNPYGECQCQMPQRCGLCTIKEYFRLNGECVKCPQSPGLVIALFFIGALLLVYAGYILSQKKFNLAFISIGVDYFQVLAILSSTSIEWPDEMVNLYHLLSVFNFNIDITAPECLVPNFSYETKWWMTEMLPIAGFGILLIMLVTVSFYRLIRYGTRMELGAYISPIIATGVTMMYFLYLSLTKRALDVFNCNPVDPDDGSLYTDFTSLDCDGGNVCRCNSLDNNGKPGLQLRLQPLAITFLILYSVGFPVFIFIVWFYNRRAMMIDQYLRASGFGESRDSNPYYELRLKFSKLYYHFKPQYTYWILLILARKLGIAFAALMLRHNGTFQLAVIVMILFASFVAQVLYRPYMSTSERDSVLDDLRSKVERSELEPELKYYVDISEEVRAAEKIFIAAKRKEKAKTFGGHTGIGLWTDNHISNVMGEGRAQSRSIDSKASEKKEKKKKDDDSKAKYFFDFNGVEMILLGCAILLSLAGIMFGSGRFEGRKDLTQQRDAITYISIIILIFSFIYYIMVALAEIFPNAMGKIVKKCCMSRFIQEGKRVRTDSLRTQENPMFSTSGPSFADTSELEGKLGQSAAELQRAERENKRLREELRAAKQKEQELAVHQNTGMVIPVTKVATRKQFGQQQNGQ